MLASMLLVLAFAGAGLGIWQVERLAWKHALIVAVETRSTASPVAAPGPGNWTGLSAERDAYRRVTVTGTFVHDREALVQAVTDLGGGYWVLTPLKAQGFTVLVNRGFVPSAKRSMASRPAGNGNGPVTVTGLLRITEPEGGFLRSNDPQADRWYSRDVEAIAEARGLDQVAPYFIDADATPNPGGYPVGGLTVVRFSDNHLVYALTWFALAIGCVWGANMVWRRG
ncbi:SURF1 family protein [Blastomonas aquatica]|uniref:SURF1-like protein n=1 Tax=Blastomonas aquatica TaxID=1510276 RepID=A0ABQ1JDQ2_9SPHN|nr:SURF1 family protein [Blastomonas aquatica]GGB66253.1 SURF1-like protein [Blastomonas aquatica]